MKKHTNFILASFLLVSFIISCTTKSVDPVQTELYEVKNDEFIKVEIDGKKFDYKTILKSEYEGALKLGRTNAMLECAGCTNQMYILFGQKDPSSTTPYSWSANIENAKTNQLVDENTPVFYIAFKLMEKIDASNYKDVYTSRTSKLANDWGDPMGEMTAKIISNENGMVSGTFAGKTVDGVNIKNGSFSLKYKL